MRIEARIASLHERSHLRARNRLHADPQTVQIVGVVERDSLVQQELPTEQARVHDRKRHERDVTLDAGDVHVHASEQATCGNQARGGERVPEDYQVCRICELLHAFHEGLEHEAVVECDTGAHEVHVFASRMRQAQVAAVGNRAIAGIRGEAAVDFGQIVGDLVRTVGRSAVDANHLVVMVVLFQNAVERLPETAAVVAHGHHDRKARVLACGSRLDLRHAQAHEIPVVILAAFGDPARLLEQELLVKRLEHLAYELLQLGIVLGKLEFLQYARADVIERT